MRVGSGERTRNLENASRRPVESGPSLGKTDRNMNLQCSIH